MAFPANVNCMPGMLIEAVMADAITKEIINVDFAEKILIALLNNGENPSHTDGGGRKHLSEYRKYGYIPYTVSDESVNETLDCCYGDYCIARAAEKLRHSNIAEKYYKYSKNYENLFDKESGFMRGKDEHGKFRNEIFNPFAWGRDYTEGSAWQNSFAVYHDIDGLDKLYDGKLEGKIDELVSSPSYFDVGGYGAEIHEMSEMACGTGGQCAISNQPSFHIPFIYSELGNVEKTSSLVKKLFSDFENSPQGFPGDEDNGSLCSWFILASIGLYQMAPSRPDFTVSMPLFDKITVKLSNGNILFIDKSKLDVKKMRSHVDYFEIMQGGDYADIVLKK